MKEFNSEEIIRQYAKNKNLFAIPECNESRFLERLTKMNNKAKKLL
jgi:hypothetical protein